MPRTANDNAMTLRCDKIDGVWMFAHLTANFSRNSEMGFGLDVVA